VRTTIYSGFQQGAAIRRNRYLRGAHRTRDAIERYPFGIPYSVAHDLLRREFKIEGAYMMSTGSAIDLCGQLLRDRLAWQVRQARRWHREWKKYAQRNRQWRAEIAALDSAD